MTTKRKHYVTFLSPGSLFSEQTTRPIEAWEPKTAVLLARSVTERHGAKPYGFYFTTSLEADDVPDGEGGKLKVEPKEVERSGIYFLTGRLRTYDEVKAAALRTEEILLSNMRCNDWPIVVENVNSYKSTHPFEERDAVVDEGGNVVERGDDPRHVEYRAKTIAAERERMREEMARW